jgi:pimeloyl-ACP methyl ester carboxylesterase
VPGELRVIEGGSGSPQLLLLHGLGATADVWAAWRPLLAERWPGHWRAPDLPGHGRSAPLADYTFAGLAEAIVPIVDPDVPTVVLGHSLGGVVGLVLADPDRALGIEAVIGLGIKVEWSEEDLQRAAAIAQRPTAWFDSREEAAARYLRVSGLDGLLSADDPAVDAGLHEEDGRWRLALDGAAFGVGAPDMPRLLARTTADVLVARGERDAMNSDDQLARLGARRATLAGLGHNAHVEDPAAVLSQVLGVWAR